MLIYDALVAFANWVWGLPMLVWLVLGGIILTFYINGVQFRKFLYIMRNTIGSAFYQEGKDGKITGYQALTAALASTLGTGNIVGVGVGIALGGPGAVFWMWVVGFVAMGIKYSEIVASIRYREPRSDGEYAAGPFMYISKGLNSKGLAVMYVVSLVTGILLAASVHTGTIVDTLETVNIPRIPATLASIALVAVIVYGGVYALVRLTEKMVPIMSVLYILGSIAVMIVHANNIIPALKSIFYYAFNPISAFGGFTGSIVANSVRWGIARGMYSSDAGNGATSIMHGQAEVNHSVEQGMWGVFEVFFDTIIVCTFTALVILSSGVWTKYGADSGAMFAAHAFSSTLGHVGSFISVAATVLFALSTVISFAYFIESQMTSLLNYRAGKFFQLLFIALMFVGGTVGVTKVLILTDVGNAISIFINMTALVILRDELRSETRDYFTNYASKETK